MADYLYDGTFEGLLTCVYHHYYNEKAQGIFRREEYQASMLSNYIEVESDTEKSETVYNAIRDKISPYDLRRVYKAFMSCDVHKEMKILNYVRYGFIKGSCISMLHGEPIVYAVQDLERKVNNEVHRLKGLIRFSELKEGVLYSPIEPDNDILEFLATHFTDRYKNEPFIIHDMKRDKALVAYKGDWYITYFTADQVPDISAAEEDYRKMWKQYFDSMAIKERINPRCQKNMMPVRYWKNMTEFQI